MMRDVEVLDMRQKYRNGMSITNIAREAGSCEKTVRKWIKNGSSPRYKPRPKRPSKLDPYKDYIMQRMAEGVFNCEILLREIKALGYTGGKTLVKNFVAPHREQFKVQAVLRFETGPGEQMQADWGYLGTFDLDGQKRRVWIFTLILGYSRFLTAHCITSTELESLLLCHELCFAQASGIAKQIVYDNMKTVTLGRDLEGKPLWQVRFLDFALYYGFKPVVCTPRKPRSKGKVESAIRYIKHNFCPGRKFIDLTDLNQQLQSWLINVANIRLHGTTLKRPLDALAEENLNPLPIIAFPTALRFARKVSRDCFFSYQGILYSVPWRFAGSEVHVEEKTGGRILVWRHNEVIAEHTLPTDGSRRVFNPRHLDGLTQAQNRQDGSALLQSYPEVERRPLSVYEEFAGVAQ